MIDFLVQIIPQYKHEFCHVYTELFIEDVKQAQNSFWEIETSSKPA
ncbi:MAG: hypothetical protein MK111_21305 [Crocosphaera sp.]|uniref:Uncharacterized protein n=3 Tax=Crocosphaera watsonii TaxID=263511 RepID=T2JMX3_CROWT|nr:MULTISPECIES: hypothetical protein [Crocosphaera]EHJ09518.1 hypothetical protein CWATWH0003_B055 [Crocosphaera watsonii WH 0003]MCH2247131.1 hypothetical protein [Crocosphaera sp.]CCQ58080.1 hypothetical protein CWATWH0005_830 [Crocosphaera watsonii WH 0005]CCQ67243.1 hypothetical protein CWATWH0402_1951 [Crocosphaera watsonii WH 0402]